MKRAWSTLLALMLLLGTISMAQAEDAGAKLIFQMSEEPTRMDPTMNDYSTGSYAIQSLFRSLYKFAEDGTIVPAMAQGHDVSDDGTVYTFYLREGLMWSDGSPLTAHDFEYSWKRVLNPEFSSETAYSLFNIIKDGYACFVEGTVAVEDLPIRALDDLTLEVELAAPIPYFVSMTVSGVFCPVKKEVVEANPDGWEWDDSAFVSNGPFRVRQMLRDERFIFEKNPYYYNADEVKIDVLEYVFLPASDTALLAFDNGDVDVAVSVNADALAKYNDTDNLLKTSRIGYRWYEFRTDHEPFDDARVRRALAMSIDREVITNAVMKTFEQPLMGFIPNGFPDIVDPSRDWREVHGSTFAEDVETAKTLLAEAGFPNGEGFPSFRLVCIPDATLELVAQAMAAMWKDNLGIEAEILTVESGIYWADAGTRKMGEFEICYMGYTGDNLDPSSILYTFTSHDNESTQWVNEEYDELMRFVSTGITGQEREDAFVRAEEILTEEMPVIPIYNYASLALVSDHVGGFTRNYGGHPIFEYAYLK